MHGCPSAACFFQRYARSALKILITGSSGFVARHFLSYLNKQKDPWEVICVDANEPNYHFDEFQNLRISFYKINLLDTDVLNKVIKEQPPDYVLHLAAFSSVAYSWNYPAESFLNNCNIFLNLCNAIKEHNSLCRILSVGSSEEYGIVKKEDLPIKETHPLTPASPYAVARVSQEMLSKVFCDSFGMQIIMTRSFNHIGPGQDERFSVSGFVKRILEIKRRGDKEGTIETGNLGIIRDFVDVRDVVRAYHILLQKGQPGEVYNICAGRRISLKDIIKQIADIVGVDIQTKLSLSFVRPGDNPEIVGSYYKVGSMFDWKPEIDLDTTLRDMIEYDRKR